MKFNLQKIYKEKVIPEMMQKSGYKNIMAVPKIEKVVVNTGTGSVKDKDRKEVIKKHLTLITGQAVSERAAKKSIASFKIRQGSQIGYVTTLHGKRMYDFLNKVVFVAIPRKRDFRGLSQKSVDEAGNLTIGFKDHLVFPEMVDEDVRNAFGLSVTVVTSANGREEALNFLKVMEFPFKK